MKTLTNEMAELRAKALKDLDSYIDFLHEFKSDIDYHRACATAGAYATIGLISSSEREEYIHKFVDASMED